MLRYSVLCTPYGVLGTLRSPSMHRFLPLTFFILAAITSGCRKPDSARPGDVEVLPVIEAKSGGEMVLIPAGSFTMGDANGRDDETPHPVSVSAFYLDKVPVTQELYTKIM